MFDLQNQVLVKTAITPASLSSDTNGIGIDRQGFERVLFSVHYGAEAGTLDGSNFWDCHIEESDDNSTYTDAAITDLNPVGTAKEFAVANADAETPNATGFTREYRGSKRYCRLVLNENGTVTAMPVAAVAILYGARKQPTANTPVLE